MNNEPSQNRALQRQLILRDSLVFFTLILITIFLFLTTLLLFRSFSSHREELGHRWYSRGQRDLASSHADDAIFDLRTALGYAPADTDYQFLLAEALKNAGKTDEAYNYFSELREADPGSGPLNLQLARLSTQRNNASDTLHYYRAAIYGTWDNNLVRNRRAVRLELIRNLLASSNTETARTELLIASEDANNDTPSELEIASLMSEAGDNVSALSLFQKTLTHVPKNESALEGAGAAAFNLGRYTTAQRYLRSAEDHARPVGLPIAATQRLNQATRILELYPSPDLPRAEHSRRNQQFLSLVRTQLVDCRLQTAGKNGADTLTQLDDQWKANVRKFSLTRLRNDLELQTSELPLAYNTLDQTRIFCPATSGDDLLLQKISIARDKVLQ
ncbi:MAG: Chloride channel protein [Acidobacteriaceae bacterium]|nr:Chloride channel protein [Acidobacteriaceae bacterium]